MKKGGEKAEQKGFVWYSLRISFYVALFLLVLSLFTKGVLSYLLIVLFLILFQFAIIVSIISLCIHKRKAFTIVALILSVILPLLYLFFFTVGLVSEVA